ncbi:MAG: 3,4-dihydroxyphenylacetate 2,3-dioxygenase [Rhodospirillaceae bacterium]|nr:MAG: 3,4-dihydroxyphenylacetate 2,3-dioxygenase [Rhodospirillaceae bacterium]
MPIHEPVLNPAFNITRASHIVLTVKDLDLSRDFYREVLGFHETVRDLDTVYLRGMEEGCHHSVVLRKADGAPRCDRIGMRMLTNEDLVRAFDFFSAEGIEVAWVERPYQGQTLHVTDPVGTQLEFCASMPVEPRQNHSYHLYRGGAAQRFDHYQIVCYDVQKAYDFYTKIGFRLTEYVCPGDADDRVWGVWLHRKGNPHDIVFTNGKGPRMHHFGMTVRGGDDLIRAADVAGSLGFGATVERGPGRHGMGGGALFLYFRDPDGHRIELFNAHYQTIDLEPPIRWTLRDPKRTDVWGMPALERWFFEATCFTGQEPQLPSINISPRTLEALIAEGVFRARF